MHTSGYLQVVEGSYKPYPCNCGAEAVNSHSPGCPQFYPPKMWPEFTQPSTQGEQCGRCWQNHTPGFVCACGCHSTTTITTYDTGNDIDTPENT